MFVVHIKSRIYDTGSEPAIELPLGVIALPGLWAPV